MEIIKKLECIGYKILLNEDKICYEFKGKSKPDPTIVGPLIFELRENKNRVVKYLKFSEANLALKIESELLNREVYFASNERIRDRVESEGLVIIGVSLDRREEAVRRFLQRTDLSYPVAMATPELVESYRPGNVIPVTFVIDKRGIIRSRHVGYMDEETLITTFKELSGEGKKQRGKDE